MQGEGKNFHRARSMMLWIRTVQQAASVRALSQAISLIKRLDGRAQDTGVNLDEEEAAMVGAVGAGAAPAPAPLPRDEPLLNEGPLLDRARALSACSRGGCWSGGSPG